MSHKFCSTDCNHCQIMLSQNKKVIDLILNVLLDKYGNGVLKIVNDICPNMTCCYNCHIDDFCHVCDDNDMCDVCEESKKYNKNLEQKFKQ